MVRRSTLVALGATRDFGLWSASALVLVTLAIFGQCSELGALHVDDWVYLDAKSPIRDGLTLAGIRSAFSSIDAPYWHPLTRLSFMVDFQVAGNRYGWFHVVNVVLHAGMALLLGPLLHSLTGMRNSSLAAALLWAVHPLRVESVAWLAERKDVLSGRRIMGR